MDDARDMCSLDGRIETAVGNDCEVVHVIQITTIRCISIVFGVLISMEFMSWSSMHIRSIADSREGESDNDLLSETATDAAKDRGIITWLEEPM